jgi:hypothetical protein
MDEGDRFIGEPARFVIPSGFRMPTDQQEQEECTPPNATLILT